MEKAVFPTRLILITGKGLSFVVIAEQYIQGDIPSISRCSFPLFSMETVRSDDIPGQTVIQVERRSAARTWLITILLLAIVALGVFGLLSLSHIEQALSTSTTMGHFVADTVDRKATELNESMNRGFDALVKTSRDGFAGVTETSKASGGLVAAKIDSLIIGVNATTQATKESLSEINKSVASLKGAVDTAGDKIITATTQAIPPQTSPPPSSPPPLPTNPPEPTPVTDDSEPDTKAIVRGNGKNPIASVYEIHAGTVSEKFPVEDVLAGKIKPSKTVGVMARSYLRGWHNGWLDAPIKADGTYHVSSQAYKVSFFSDTIDFEIRRYK